MLYLLCNSWVTSQYLKHSKNWPNKTLTNKPLLLVLFPWWKIQLKPVQLESTGHIKLGFGHSYAEYGSIMAWDSISKVTLLNYKIVTAGEHFNKSTTYVRSSLYRLIIQWFAFLSLLSYSIIMLRPYSIAWAGTTVVSYYFTYVPLEMPQNVLLCCRLMNCLYCHPILGHCLPKSVHFCLFPSWLPAQYALSCLSITGWKRTLFKLGAWV